MLTLERPRLWQLMIRRKVYFLEIVTIFLTMFNRLILYKESQICLKYHVTPTEIRQSNRFSGSNLALAPDSLMIPLKRNLPPIVKQPAQDSKDQKINAFMRIMNSKVGGAGKMKERIGRKEAVAYLEINDYNVEESVADAKDDLGWEAQDARNKYCQNATAESSLLIEMA
eukprot:256373_1